MVIWLLLLVLSGYNREGFEKKTFGEKSQNRKIFSACSQRLENCVVEGQLRNAGNTLNKKLTSV